MRLSKFGLAAAIAAGFVFAGGGGTASATCYSSTASSQTFSDGAADSELGLAPELLGVAAVTDSACGIGIGPAIAGVSENGLIEGEAVGVYLNTDGSAATGSTTFGGADKVVMTVGAAGADYPPAMGSWTGAAFRFAGAPTLTPVDAAGFVSTIDQLGIASPATIGIQTASLYEGVSGNLYSDFAPEVGTGSFQFPVAFSTTAPTAPPTGTAPVTPPVAPPNAVVPDSTPPGCVVPKIKGKSVLKAVASLVKAGCKYKIVKVKSKKKVGQVVSVSPSAGSTTSKRVIVKVSKGSKVTKSSAAAPAVYAAAESKLRDAAE